MAGNSPLFPTTPEGTSVVYNGRPFSADSLTFVVTPAPVPEPATVAIMVTGGLMLLAYRRFSRAEKSTGS